MALRIIREVAVVPGNGVTEMGHHSVSPPFTFPSSEESQVSFYCWVNREFFEKSCVLTSGPSVPVKSALTTWPQCLSTLGEQSRIQLMVSPLICSTANRELHLLVPPYKVAIRQVTHLLFVFLVWPLHYSREGAGLVTCYFTRCMEHHEWVNIDA